MHVELIEARRLMAATGLDTSFADSGTLNLSNGVQRSGTPLAVAGALYVGAVDDGQGYVYKYGADGKPDLDFGDNGRAAINVMPQKIAYERKSGAVYAAGHDLGEQGAVEGVYVARVNADGSTDRNYGTASGAYVPTLGNYFHIGTEVQGLYVSPFGKLLMTVSVNTSINDPLPTDGIDRGASDLNLIRLNAAGKRDGDFGRRGTRMLYSASNRNDERDSSNVVATSDAAVFADAQFNASGGGRVVFTHERKQGVTNYGREKNTVKITAEAFVESRALDADGNFTVARTWSLGKTKPSDARDTNPRNLFTLAAQAVPGTDVRAFAIRDSLKPLVYALTKDNEVASGKTPAPVTLSLPSTGAVDELASRIGVVPLMKGYYVTNGRGGVVKYRNDNTVDRGFADNGIATFVGTGLADDRIYTADAAGRLLVLSHDAIRRVDEG